MAVLTVFSQKKGLGPLGVKIAQRRVLNMVPFIKKKAFFYVL